MKLIQSTIFGLLFVAFVLTALFYDCERDERIRLQGLLEQRDSINTVNIVKHKKDSTIISNTPLGIDNYYELSK